MFLFTLQAKYFCSISCLSKSKVGIFHTVSISKNKIVGVLFSKAFYFNVLNLFFDCFTFSKKQTKISVTKLFANLVLIYVFRQALQLLQRPTGWSKKSLQSPITFYHVTQQFNQGLKTVLNLISDWPIAVMRYVVGVGCWWICFLSSFYDFVWNTVMVIDQRCFILKQKYRKMC